MVAPVIIAALITAAASIGGSMLADKGGQQTGIQKKQGNLIDQLMASLGGEGPFSDLFGGDEDAFKKSFTDPAMAQFNNRTAPGIQQQFVSSGLQRGTGLDDSLSRAGVDMQSMLNSEYMNFQNNAMNRKSSLINSILGMGAGPGNPMTTGQQAAQGAAGYLQSEGFSGSVDKILKEYQDEQKQKAGTAGADTVRPGYENTATG